MAGEWMAAQAGVKPSILCRGTRATQDVLSLRHGFQVVRVDTVANSAQVIEGQSFGNRADQQFPYQAVSKNGSVATRYSQRQSSVPARLDLPGPDPAVISDLDALEHTVL